jgi:hypothetical protein
MRIPYEREFAEEEAPAEGRLGRSPLTDPRALLSSLVIHVLLLAVASALAFRVAATRTEPTPSRTLLGELESVDNRAPGDPGGGGGGDPESRAADVSAEKGMPAPPTRDPAADELLSEILPTRKTTETTAQTLPGPSTSGLGMLSGFTSGDGGGQGGGAGGGSGPGNGPGTQFFGMRDRGTSFAYVIDRSGSMTARNSLDVAKHELLASLAQIPPDARFAVIFYNNNPTVFTDPSGHPGLMPATPSNKARVRALLSTVDASLGTEHMLALRAALALKPEVIFFLTDADLMNRLQVAAIVAEAGKTRIQAVEFGTSGGRGGTEPPLKTLARSTGGSYKYIDVNSFGR